MQRLRFVVAILVGNVLGFLAWRGAQWFVPQIWGQAEEPMRFSTRLALIAFSAIVLAAPPVLLGALSGWLAKSAPAIAGFASGLWSILLVGRAPVGLQLFVPVWYAPMVLVLLSCTLGGWMIDLRFQAQQLRERASTP